MSPRAVSKGVFPRPSRCRCNREALNIFGRTSDCSPPAGSTSRFPLHRSRILHCALMPQAAAGLAPNRVRALPISCYATRPLHDIRVDAALVPPCPSRSAREAHRLTAGGFGLANLAHCARLDLRPWRGAAARRRFEWLFLAESHCVVL